MTAVYITKTAKDGAGNAFNAALQDQDGFGASVAGVHALRNAAGADINPATLMDTTFMRRLEESGFIAQLQARYRE